MRSPQSSAVHVCAALVAVVAVVIGVEPALNSRGVETRAVAGPADVLGADPRSLMYSYAPSVSEQAMDARLSAADASTTTIAVSYSGFAPDAQAAFQAAVNILASTISSPVPIRVNVSFTPLAVLSDYVVLGLGGPSVLCNRSNVGLANTFYAAALADKLNGAAFCAAAGGKDSEINISVNSLVPNWDFGTGGVPVFGKVSFLTVALHELTHGLGFSGGMTASGGVGSFGAVRIYDRFAVTGGGAPLISFANPSVALGSQLVSDNTYFSGLLATGGNNGTRPKLESRFFTESANDSGFLAGASFDHLDDSLYTATPNGLMTWLLAQGEVYTDLGPVARGILQDLGWGSTNGDAAALVSETIPDDTVMLPGHNFRKTWTLRNSGTTTWTSDYSLQYVSGNAGCNHSPVRVVGTVTPNATYTFSVDCTAPTQLTTFREDWRLIRPSGPTVPVSNSPTIWAKIVTRTTLAAALRFDTVLSPQTANSSFDITVTAVDVSGNRVLSFNGDVGLYSTLALGTTDVLTRKKVTLTAGQATAQIAVTRSAAGIALNATGQGLSGTSNAFDVGGTDSMVSVRVEVKNELGNWVSSAAVHGTFDTLQIDQTTLIGTTTFWAPCPTTATFDVVAGTLRGRATASVPCQSPPIVRITLLETTCAPGGRAPVVLLPGMIGSTTGMADFYPTLPPPGETVGFDWREWTTGPYSFGYGFYGLFDPLQNRFAPLGWKALFAELYAQGYRLGCTVFPAPFDWRLDLDTVVDRYLAPVIEHAKLVSRSADGKVDIVAHSTGGLVVRAYLRRYGTTSLRRLAFAGVPNAGGVSAYFLVHGGDVGRADDSDWWKAGLDKVYENTVSALMTSVGLNPYDCGLRTTGCINRARIKAFIQGYVASGRALLPVFPFLIQPGQNTATPIPEDASGGSNAWLRDLNLAQQGQSLPGVEIKLFGGKDEATYQDLRVQTDSVYTYGAPIAGSAPSTQNIGDGTVLQASLVAALGLTPTMKGANHTNLIHRHLPGSDGIVAFLTNATTQPDAQLATTTSPPAARATVASDASASAAPALLDIAVSGPAVALVTGSSALSAGITSALDFALDIPGSDVVSLGGLMSVSVPDPFSADGTGGPLSVQFTTTGTGHYDVQLRLDAGGRALARPLRFHTTHHNRALSLSWDQRTATWSVDVGAAPPALVTTAPAGPSTRISWSAVSGATGYRVFRQQDGQAFFDLIATLDGSTTTWVSADDLWSTAAAIVPAEFAVSTLIGTNESAFSDAVINNDQDGDGLTDEVEVILGTNPALLDSDGDGLSDWTEHQSGTSPLLIDSDGDGLSDSLETQVGSDPERADITSGPAPDISSVSPTPVVAGQNVTLTVNGSAFFNGVSVVRVAGQPVTTAFVNGSQLTATIAAGSLCPPGLCPITVDNDAPGGGLSNTVYLSVQAATPNLIQNGQFDAGTSNWLLFATNGSVQDMNYMPNNVTGGVFQFARNDPPAGSNQAVIFQQTGSPLATTEPVLTQFDLGNLDAVRKRISVLVHDSNFTDLSVCTFWLPANAPIRTYAMRTHTTKAWANATVSFYAASVGGGTTGGFYQLDNVSLQRDSAGPTDATQCLDPTTPNPTAGAPSADLLLNGNFASGAVAPGWGTFGQIQSQVAGGVFEFIKLAGTPAGVILQPTGQALPTNELLTTTFSLGNSSGVRKRVTVLLHDLDFSDLAACTFWLEPGQPLSPYALRTFTTKPWTNTTLSFYPATVGAEQWIRLDDVTLQRTPAAAIIGTECVEPSAAADALMSDARSAPARSLGTSALAPQAPVADAAADDPRGPAAIRLLIPTETDGWLAEGFTRTGEPSSPATTEPSWVAVAIESAAYTLQRTAPIDLTSATGARLQFESWLSATASRAAVEVSTDGVTWETVHSVAPADTWTQVDVGLRDYLGEFIFVRFVFDAVAPVDLATPETWKIDAVRIEADDRLLQSLYRGSGQTPVWLASTSIWATTASSSNTSASSRLSHSITNQHSASMTTPVPITTHAAASILKGKVGLASAFSAWLMMFVLHRRASASQTRTAP